MDRLSSAVSMEFHSLEMTSSNLAGNVMIIISSCMKMDFIGIVVFSVPDLIKLLFLKHYFS